MTEYTGLVNGAAVVSGLCIGGYGGWVQNYSWMAVAGVTVSSIMGLALTKYMEKCPCVEAIKGACLVAGGAGAGYGLAAGVKCLQVRFK